MDIIRLRYFLTIADTGSLRRAAELLHVTSTALSKAMKVLQAELGIPLLQPRGRGIALTEAGIELAERVRPLLAELATIPHDVATQRSTPRPLRYGSHETFGTAFARLVAMGDPSLDIEHRYLVPEDMPAALLERHIDLAVSYIAVPASGIDVTPHGSLELGIFGRPRWNDTPFAALPFAAPARPAVGLAPRAQTLDAWPNERHARLVRYRVTHTQTALELCRAGLAVAYLPRFLVELFDEHVAHKHRLVQIEGPPGTSQHRQPVYLSTRAGERPSSARCVEHALEAITV